MEISYKVNIDINIKEYLIFKSFSRDIFKQIKDSIYVNNEKKRLWQDVKKGDILKIVFPDEENTLEKTPYNLDIRYEDEYFLIIYKSSKTYSMSKNKTHYDSITNYIAYYFDLINIKSKSHLVNRLDYETQGLMIIAKHQFIHSIFKDTNIIKKYYARVYGNVEKSGIINKPITKDDNSIKRLISDNGLSSVTKYEVVSNNESESLLRVTLLTGRTHQIRVHLNSIGHPIIGDSLYGNGTDLKLQSYYLEFFHPITNKKILIETEVKI